MFMNGVRTGMEITAAVHRRAQQDHHLVPPVWAVAAAGSAMRGAVVCRIVATSIRTTGATTTASALSFSLVQMMDVNCSKQYLIKFIFT